jgi:hypothetical protein
MMLAAICIVVATFLVLCADAILSSTSGSISISYSQANGNAPAGSLDVPIQNLSRSVVGIAPDQIKVIFWGNNSYLISWASSDGLVGPNVAPPPANLVDSIVMYSHTDVYLNTSAVMNATGISLTYTYDYSKDISHGYLLADYLNGPGPTFLTINYVSPVLHHVLLEGLLPGTTYYYKVGDPRYYYGMSPVISFKTMGAAPGMPSALPFRLGVIADVGQTLNTTAMLKRLMETPIDALSLIGDFTYADNYGADGCMYYNFMGAQLCPFSFPEGDVGEQTYQPRWDTFGRLMQPIMSKIPFMFTNGNHEIEELPTGARFTGVNARYPGPPAAEIYSSIIHNYNNQNYLQTIVQGQPMDDEFDPMGAYKNMFYAVDVPGAKMIFLTTFIGGDNFNSSSVQYQWFEKTLKAINRTETPWVIVNFHFPMYSSYAGGYQGVECFRLSYEPLFYTYGVDVAFNGHIHSYERTNPVYDYNLNNCGTVHITIGDGGNNEGISKYFIDEVAAEVGYCAPGKYESRVFPEWQPQACFTTFGPNHTYCPTSQPVWSAYRNPSWGFGVLTIINSTTAHWLWNNTDNGSNATDEAYFTRNPACLNGVNSPTPPAMIANPPNMMMASPPPSHHEKHHEEHHEHHHKHHYQPHHKTHHKKKSHGKWMMIGEETPLK